MPDTLLPMKASTAREVPRGSEWTYESKLDGIRVLALASSGAVRLMTRNGNDRAGDFPEVARAVGEIAAGKPLVLDGEIVALVDGRPARFQALQRRNLEGAGEAALAVFDVLRVGAKEMVDLPWTERRAELERLMAGNATPRLILVATTADADALLEQARAEGAEGIMAKRTDALYRPGKRSDAWLKLKLEHRQEFVVGGFTPPQRTRPDLGALLLGVYEGDDLVYTGKVGTGFTHADLADLRRRLERIERKTSPFVEPPRIASARWVRPQLAVEVRFNEWTREGLLRQPAFQGLRTDKDAREIVREPESLA